MKKLIYIIIIALLIPIALSAQKKDKITIEKPDFDKIKTETLNPKSKFYFPKLMKLFLANDTTMDVSQYRYLYYGYLFQEDYNPYRTSEFSDVIEPLYFKENRTREDCDTIEKYAELSLADNPFDLRQMQFLIIALNDRKKINRAKIRQYKLQHLLKAILSSGNGTKEHPWYVIAPAHEYNLLNFTNIMVTEHVSLGDSTDYLKVQKANPKSPEGYYFDVSRVIDIYTRKFEVPKDQTQKPAAVRRRK